MNRWILTIAFASVAAASDAAVISRDWKTPGDGLLTYDDVTKREWLDFPVTRLSQFPGTTTEENYQYAIGQTAPGGLFEGFTPAASVDVVQLATSAGIVTSTHVFATNEAPTLTLIQLLGATSTPLPRTAAAALLAEVQGAAPAIRIGALLLYDPHPHSPVAGLIVGTSFDYFAAHRAGIALYRQVPEPSVCGVVMLALALIRHRSHVTARHNGRAS